MFKREIWDNFTEFTFWNFEISKFQKMNNVNFPQIPRINMWFLVNHIWQALKNYTRVRITQKQSISTNLINMAANSYTTIIIVTFCNYCYNNN